MVCNTCGRYSHSEDANFCEYCGSSFRENRNIAFNSLPQNQPYGQAAPIKIEKDNSTSKPVSFLNWLGTYALLLIPYAGGLVFIVMLFVWAFKEDTPESKKNWARSTLIFVAVMIIFLVINIMILLNSGILQSMLNGTFDFNSYSNSLYQSLN